jgi:hypothetical protein
MASKGSIASRSFTARERIAASIATISEQAGVPYSVPTGPALRVAEMKALVEAEALADFLEALLKKAAGPAAEVQVETLKVVTRRGGKKAEAEAAAEVTE